MNRDDAAEPKGSSSGSNQRSFLALQELYNEWSKEFPAIKCPISKPLGYAPIPGLGDGMVITEYTDRFGAHRVSNLSDSWPQQIKDKVDVIQFVDNFFRTLKIGHKRLSATFTNDAGSALTPHNVTLDGEIKDLETYPSPSLGDRVSSEEAYVEDIRIAIETLTFVCEKTAKDTASCTTLLAKAIVASHRAYTNS